MPINMCTIIFIFIWYHLVLSGTISNYLRLSGTIWDYFELSQTFSDYLGLLETIWDYLGLSGTIWDYLGLSGNIFDYLGLSGSIWVQAKAGESNILLFETFSLSLFFTHAIPRGAHAPKNSLFCSYSFLSRNAR